MFSPTWQKLFGRSTIFILFNTGNARFSIPLVFPKKQTCFVGQLFVPCLCLCLLSRFLGLALYNIYTLYCFLLHLFLLLLSWLRLPNFDWSLFQFLVSELRKLYLEFTIYSHWCLMVENFSTLDKGSFHGSLKWLHVMWTCCKYSFY